MSIYSTLTLNDQATMTTADAVGCDWLLLLINPDDVNVPMNILPSACVRS